MPTYNPQPALNFDPACASAVAALEDDPFYQAICAPHSNDAIRRRTILMSYFDYSIQEGRDLGRCVHLADNPSLGVAVWLLPQPAKVQSQAAAKKRAFLEATLPAEGGANYYRIFNFMHARTATVVPADGWYLSIIAVDPAAQGQGFGRKLIEPTLAEADRVSATCYLETFTPRNISFYERLGFATVARFAEPSIGADCTVMFRPPGKP